MLSTGSKLFVGLAGLTTAAFTVYGITQNFGALGAVGLFFLMLALMGLATAVIFTRDGDISAMDTAAVQTAPSGAQPSGDSMWPFVAAASAVLLIVGLVTDKRYFVAGLGIMVVAIVEWMVRAWADRASADTAFNQGIRRRIMHPLELPLAGLAGLAVVIYGFSRMMVAADKNIGPVILGVGAALILAFGVTFSAKQNMRRGLVAGICALGGVAVLAGGIASASMGQRDELTVAREEDHFDSRAGIRHCEEEGESDEDASGSVSLLSNTVATFTFDGAKLEIDQIAGSLDGQALTVDRGNAVSVLFVNETEEPHRLRIYAGTKASETKGADGNPILTDVEFCTRAIGEGKTQLLTFKMPKPSLADPEGYYAEVPGVEGARVEVVVP